MRRLTLVALLLLGAGSAQADEMAPRSVVFFPSWSALIDKPAQATVADAAARAKTLPNAQLVVTGYASTVGSVDANTLLARLRAVIVRDELVADGVPAARITLASVGPTSFVLDPVESRRTEIGFVAR